MTPRSHASVVGRDAVVVSRVGAHLVPTVLGKIRDVQNFGGRSGLVMDIEDGRQVVAYWHELRLLA
jgi:hypothetical protein